MAWNDGQEASTFNVTSNANHSGNFIYNIAGVKEAEIIWTATGTGTYWLRGDQEPITGLW